jgi:hypothetical protein
VTDPAAAERFETLVDQLSGEPGVTVPGAAGGTGFGAGTLRVDAKIFAMLVAGRLVVKLPKARVDALVAAGQGSRFDGNKGRPMREWLSLDRDAGPSWESLAREALGFVKG